MYQRQNSEIPILDPQKYHDKYYSNGVDVPLRSSTNHFEITCRSELEETIRSHRLDFYLVYLVTKGKGKHKIGSKTYSIKENMLGFVGPNIVSAWKSKEKKQKGYSISFSSEFYHLNLVDKQFLNKLSFFQLGGTPFIDLSRNQTKNFQQLFKQTYNEFLRGENDSMPVLRSLLQAIINKASSTLRTKQVRNISPTNAQERILQEFKELLLNDFKPVRDHIAIKRRRVVDYAEELGVTQNHLNDTIKSITGKSAGQLIQEQVIKQAKMCLSHSDLDIAEIAFRLGFDDPSYFSRSFKKQTGYSPTSFRKNNIL